jgi:hypothetical protein
MNAEIEEFGWFGAGWSVFKGPRIAGYSPPLNDSEAQREWLGGFGAAYAEYPDTAEDGEKSVRGWLADACASQPTELYQQLLLHGVSAGNA